MSTIGENVLKRHRTQSEGHLPSNLAESLIPTLPSANSISWRPISRRYTTSTMMTTIVVLKRVLCTEQLVNQHIELLLVCEWWQL